MSLTKVDIRNFKSIKRASISLNNINCLIGQNGSGKSNILRAIEYFYQQLIDNDIDKYIFDKNNPYINCVEITLTYDLTKLYTIASSQIVHLALNSDAENNHLINIYKKIKAYIDTFADDFRSISVTLRQFKNGSKDWGSIPYEFRLFLKNTFPIYMVKSRHINLTDWDSLWDVIGDASKIRSDKDNNLESEIEEVFKRVYKDNYIKSLQNIKSEFSLNNIRLDKFSPKQKFSHIYQLQLGGRKFKHNNEDLDYFSDGSNSYNYLRLLTNLLGKISEDKLKEPIIIVDEPEIGLHPGYIDNLSETFIRNSHNINIIIATHSSRMIKNILENCNNFNMYHTSIVNNYTKIQKMKKFSDIRENSKVSEKEASFYFSNAIVFVEGNTEIQVFTNKNILNIYPELRKVDFYSYDSDNIKLRVVHPIEKNTYIPYLLIIDLDKILRYEKVTQKFCLKSDEFVNPLSNEHIENREKFYYGLRRVNTYNLRKRIKGILKRCNFYFDEPWEYITDGYFILLKSLINEYCQEYNVFPVDTTIEGSLINKDNYEIVYEWLITLPRGNIVEEICNYSSSMHYRVTALRLIVNGKYDSLNEIVETEKVSDEGDKRILKKISNIKMGKTEGWVGEFLEYYFKKYISNCSGKQQKRKKFKEHFKELDLVINSAYKLVKIQ